MWQFNDQINNWLIAFLNYWISYAEQYWPIVGLIFGLCLVLMWITRGTTAAGFFSVIAIAALIFQPGLFYLLPQWSQQLVGQQYQLGEHHLWAFIIGSITVVVMAIILARWMSPYIEIVRDRFTKRSSIERNRRTDIRQIGKHLPNAQKLYDPQHYIKPKKGIFFGLDERRNPVYMPWNSWRKSHLQIVGTSGTGKGVAAGVLLSQAVRTGETVIVIDPKNDEFLAHVLYKTAKEIGVPYAYIDLTADVPQWNPLQGKRTEEIEELLSVGFSLGEKGTDADFYRLDDRRAARIFSSILPEPRPTIADAYRQLMEEQPQLADTAKKFIADIQELGLMPVTMTDRGLDLGNALQAGAVVYVRGSMRNPRVLKLQKVVLVSVIQHIESRDRESARHVCIFLDEFKYLISRPALEALGAIRDKRAHVMIAHQSLGDLRDCPADLDPDSVVASVNDNCAVKIAYATQDPDTADWLARKSGHILVDDEIRKMKTNSVLAETRENERSLRQAERPLIDTNMMQSLPDRCAVLYGVGLARFIFTSPVPVTKAAAATTPTRFVSTKKKSSISAETTSPVKTFGQALLDVD